MSKSLDPVLEKIDSNLPSSIDRLFDLLRIQSISTDPAYSQDCKKAADWLVDSLSGIGFTAQRHDTPGHPMVVAKAGDGAHHYLFYGHYDVQPADPLDLWHSDPFDPQLEDTADGKVIRARGAADDKGQLLTFVEACRAYMEVHGKLPAQITLFFEGEEESGSPSLIPFMQEHKELLTAELAMVCDTGMWDSQTPAISTMLRGMVGVQITITGPDRDLHSGMYGGPARNPIRVLNKILAGLHDDDGRVTLPRFYDGVDEVPDTIKAQWNALNHDSDAFLNAVGLSEPAGETNYSVLEQIWARPTCDVNGIIGGYTGEGFKTVLPSEASAKISFRLVGDQDPDKINAALRDYIKAHLPSDCSVSYKSKDSSRATVMPTSAPEFKQAHAALSEEWPKPAVFAGCGGSIPVVGHIKNILGMDSLLIGFGLDDDAIHSPNEKYDLQSFHKGIRSWARVLDALCNEAET
ncbi:MAG: M20/M25/M40 family metallo-hydrolase [Gammaproteobacteria bacterium]|nr:M20/M25/M40 family metallo-hydrolase [Gammaproteobacteria bacterium]